MTKVVSRDPSTGRTLKEFEPTSSLELKEAFTKARGAQVAWAALSPKKRSRYLLQIREVLLNHIDEVVDLIALENGKPKFEALANEIIPALDMLTYFAKHGPRVLKDRRIPLVLMKHRLSYLNYWPLGVVTIISPWNYPLLLPFGEILMALVAGNAIVFKPSEATPQVGLKIQEICEEAGIPAGILNTVIGDGSLGAAIIHERPAKIFFTGSVATGKKIMASAAEYLIPVSLELGGKDAMIVMPDADLDHASSAAVWGGFGNSGQTCASVERVIVHENVAEKFTALLKNKLKQLIPGQDLGSVTIEKQKGIYNKQLAEATEQLANISGGNYSVNCAALEPTVVTGPDVEKLSVYKDESFGPIVALTTFKSPAEAVKKANDSPYGLLASVMTKNHSLGEQIALQLEVGTVTVNEVVYTAGLGETPWGGVKDSGFGRTHSEAGLLEFVNVRHIHMPRSRLFVFKSPWWFPYGPYQYAMFRQMAELYRGHWTDKIRAFPHFLWNAVQFLKREKWL